jgi:hypothetical protein
MSFSMLLSSCYSYRRISGRAPITPDVIAKLKRGKTYKFELNSGLTQVIDITAVGNETVTGFVRMKDINGKSVDVAYSSSYETIEKGVVKISKKTFNPLLAVTWTAAFVGIVAIAVGASYAVFLEDIF